MSDIPADANESCPGTKSERAGKTNACAGCPNQQACSTGVKPVDPDIEFIRDRLRNVKHKILILSGKGGVGKSTVTTNLALALASDRRVATSAGGGDEPVTGPLQVGVLDVDICGPSQARMFGCEGESVHDSADGWSPVYVADNLGVMSIAFLMDGRDEAVIWRGPRKNALIKQFLRNVDWGNVDYLLIDTPPGTSDEHISIVQLLLDASTIDGAIVVTTPQEVSLLDVRKEINFCRKTHVPILGVVENMSRFICPCCSTATALFPSTTGGAMHMCAELDLPLLAQLPHDPRMAECVDGGESYADAFGASAPLTTAFDALAAAVVSRCAAGDHSGQSTSSEQ